MFYKDGQLVVHVSRARGLAGANSNGFSDPYVKTYLLPDKSKHSKRKSTIKRKTLDPVYDETLQVGLPISIPILTIISIPSLLSFPFQFVLLFNIVRSTPE